MDNRARRSVTCYGQPPPLLLFFPVTYEQFFSRSRRRSKKLARRELNRLASNRTFGRNKFGNALTLDKFVAVMSLPQNPVEITRTRINVRADSHNGNRRAFSQTRNTRIVLHYHARLPRWRPQGMRFIKMAVRPDRSSFMVLFFSGFDTRPASTPDNATCVRSELTPKHLRRQNKKMPR